MKIETNRRRATLFLAALAAVGGLLHATNYGCRWYWSRDIARQIRACPSVTLSWLEPDPTVSVAIPRENCLPLLDLLSSPPASIDGDSYNSLPELIVTAGALEFCYEGDCLRLERGGRIFVWEHSRLSAWSRHLHPADAAGTAVALASLSEQ